jgi:cytochrome bd-type quinol oxidase subunit 2
MFSRFEKIITPAFIFIFAQTARAQEIIDNSVAKEIDNQADALSSTAGFNKNLEVGSVMGTVIKSFFSVMGIVFLIIILHAGYKWMNANGKKDDVEEAKNSIMRATIGLAIMIVAYALTAFIFKQIDQIPQ